MQKCDTEQEMCNAITFNFISQPVSILEIKLFLDIKDAMQTTLKTNKQ